MKVIDFLRTASEEEIAEWIVLHPIKTMECKSDPPVELYLELKCNDEGEPDGSGCYDCPHYINYDCPFNEENDQLVKNSIIDWLNSDKEEE